MDLEKKISNALSGMLRVGKGKYIIRNPKINQKQSVELSHKGKLPERMKAVSKIYQGK